jgi:hypothetical protein
MRGSNVFIRGALAVWRPLAIEIVGPFRQENPETFRDFALSINLTNQKSGETLTIHGFFAADGDAAQTNARSGKLWRAWFTPPNDGVWRYTVSFKKGADIALRAPLGTVEAGDTPAAAVDGATGELRIAAAKPGLSDQRDAGPVTFEKGALHFIRGSRVLTPTWRSAAFGALAARIFGGPPSLASHALVAQSVDMVNDANGGDSREWRENRVERLAASLARDSITALCLAPLLVHQTDSAIQVVLSPYSRRPDEPVFAPSLRSVARVFHVSRLEKWTFAFEQFNLQGITVFLCLEALGGTLARLSWNDSGHQIERHLFLREMVTRFGHLNGIVWGATASAADAAFIRAMDGHGRTVCRIEDFATAGGIPQRVIGAKASTPGLVFAADATNRPFEKPPRDGVDQNNQAIKARFWSIASTVKQLNQRHLQNSHAAKQEAKNGAERLASIIMSAKTGRKGPPLAHHKKHKPTVVTAVLAPSADVGTNRQHAQTKATGLETAWGIAQTTKSIETEGVKGAVAAAAHSKLEEVKSPPEHPPKNPIKNPAADGLRTRKTKGSFWRHPGWKKKNSSADAPARGNAQADQSSGANMDVDKAASAKLAPVDVPKVDALKNVSPSGSAALLEIVGDAALEMRLYLVSEQSGSEDGRARWGEVSHRAREIDLAQGLDPAALIGSKMNLVARVTGDDAAKVRLLRLSITAVEGGHPLLDEIWPIDSVAVMDRLGAMLLGLPTCHPKDRGLRRLSIAALGGDAAAAPIKTWKFAIGKWLEAPTPPRMESASKTFPCVFHPIARAAPKGDRDEEGADCAVLLALYAVEIVDVETDRVVAPISAGGRLDSALFADRAIALRAVMRGQNAAIVQNVDLTISADQNGVSERLCQRRDLPYPFGNEVIAAFYGIKFPKGAVTLEIRASASGRESEDALLTQQIRFQAV